MLRTMHWTGLLVLASLMTGCAHMYDVTDDCMMKWRCCHEAKMAWLRCRDLYADVCYPFDFGQGFRDGYQSVCMGSDGCAPAMPPRSYWSYHYQCDEGKCQIMAWYDGYHHGALAAQCDGCEGRSQVLCASDLYGDGACGGATDYSDIEHNVVPEDEMQGYDPSGGHYGAPVEMDHGMPMAPAPVGPASGDMMVPEPEYDVSTEVGPTPVPELKKMLAPGIDATVAPSF